MWRIFFVHLPDVEVQSFLGVPSSKSFPVRSQGNLANSEFLRAQKFEFKAGLMYYWVYIKVGGSPELPRL